MTVRPESVANAVHVDGEQPVGVACTVTVCEPPFDGNETAAGEIENVQATVTAIACRPVNPWIVAMISASPGPTAVTTPPAVTETRVESDDDHCAALV